ncbi:MAG: hypothetical protein JNL28_14475 [Planctomycetes bacterium]|nr:hypothetical protein [Planctomycetota bacterium]
MSSLGVEVGARPRVLRVDLTRAFAARGSTGAGLEPYADLDPALERVGLASGSALAHALIQRALRDQPDAATPLVFAVGEAVRAALPTAARTSVLARAPLSGAIAEGQIGGPFARALAAVADALLLSGTTGAQGVVLVVGTAGAIDFVVDDRLVGADPRASAELLEERFGTRAGLVIGAAGEAGVAFASIASLDQPPSFVGRGGLGAVFGALGLKAVVVLAAPVEPDPARAIRDRELQRALLRSPRLRARAAGGTLELAQRAALAGESHNHPAQFEALVSDSVAKKGCDGCPTPCGLVFERGHPRGTTRHLGRFGAISGLAEPLGLSVDDARVVLERCDELALDAKEAGHVLALVDEDLTLSGALRRLDDIVMRRGIGATLALGAHRAAQALGVASRRREKQPRSQNLAVRLAAAISPPGTDPMRTFPFLAVDAASRAQLVAAMDGLPLPLGAEDPRDPAGKGRIVWWHENLVAAVDASGFCAFSAAGLLSDGVCTVAELARWIAPPSIAAEPDCGRALLALGASIQLLKRTTRTASILRVDPALEHPALIPEYARLRGLDTDGTPARQALALIGDVALLEIGGELEGAIAPAYAARVESSTHTLGRVAFLTRGPLNAALAGDRVLARELPARLDECIADLAQRVPRAARWLVLDGRPVPQAWRGGVRLEPSDLVFDGDRIDLVIAVGGG